MMRCHTDGRAGYQDYIHNLDKLTVYVDVNSHRNYFTRRRVTAAGGGGRARSGSKRAASWVGDGDEATHVDAGTVCGVSRRAAVATAAGARHGESPAAASDVPLAAPFPARIHLPCRQPIQGRYVYIEASGVPSRYSRLFGAILCDIIVYQ